jgi:dihydrofolate reductase
MDELNATGAIVVGRRTVEQVDHWGGDHHGVPIFVPSHRPPGPSAANYPLVTYVTDGIASAMAQAKAAAGDRNVLVHGAYTAQRALEAGVLDELQIHQIPVLFGGGRRLFEVLPSRVELEIVRVIDTPEAIQSATASVAEPAGQRPLGVVGRGELTDRAWARIEPLLPVSGRGRRWRAAGEMIPTAASRSSSQRRPVT